MSPLSKESWVEAAHLEHEMSDIAVIIDKIQLSAENRSLYANLEDSSAIMGLNPASDIDVTPKEVRFNARVNVYEVTALQSPNATNVKFSDKVVNIGLPNSGTRDTPRKPQKRVRFSCLKHPKQPLTHGLSLLQLLRRRTLGPVSNASVTAKKHVRFGALKSQKAKYPDLTFGHRDSEWDEAETRRTFLRECAKHKALQPLSSINEGEAEDEWDST